MKVKIRLLIVIVFATYLAAIASAQVPIAAGSASPRNVEKQDFSMIGTVTERGVGTCMSGINYELHAANPKTAVVPLSVSTQTNKNLLERAVSSDSWVRVTGKKQTGTEAHCEWVAVATVRPVDKPGTSNFFTGISSRGSISEALKEAIDTAKDSLMSDFVVWKLEKVDGTNGGFVQLDEISVTISASKNKK